MFYLHKITSIKKRDKNHTVSQMAHAKNLGEPCMTHVENLYNIPWTFVNHMLYADDICIISLSSSGLQRLLNIRDDIVNCMTSYLMQRSQ